MNISPKVVLDDTDSKIRKVLRDLVQSQRYDIFILVCTTINTFVLTINWYSQPVSVDDTLDYINYIFATIFAFDCIFKIVGLGP